MSNFSARAVFFAQARTALPTFALRLTKNGELVQEGSGKNVLKSPALCLAELSVAMARQAGSA